MPYLLSKLAAPILGLVRQHRAALPYVFSEHAGCRVLAIFLENFSCHLSSLSPHLGLLTSSKKKATLILIKGGS